jgi:hypothetical protein
VAARPSIDWISPIFAAAVKHSSSHFACLQIDSKKEQQKSHIITISSPPAATVN